MTLAHAAGNVNQLHPHVPTGFVDLDLISTYGEVAKVPVDGRMVFIQDLLPSEKICRASTERLCADRKHAGSVAAILTAERSG